MLWLICFMRKDKLWFKMAKQLQFLPWTTSLSKLCLNVCVIMYV